VIARGGERGKERGGGRKGGEKGGEKQGWAARRYLLQGAFNNICM
jgi:hypothetical protein